MSLNQEEFDQAILNAEKQNRREKMKQAIQFVQANVKPFNGKEYTAARQSYLLNNPAGTQNHAQKLRFQEYIDRLDSTIQADAEKFGYTSAFNWMLYLALDDEPTEQPTLSQQRETSLPKSYSLISRITNYAYPTLIGQIEDGSLTVVNNKYEDCQYALLKQAPDEIELPDLSKPPYAFTLYSPEFYRQFDILKTFFVLFDDDSEQTEITTTHKPTGITPEKKEAKREATKLAKQHWDAEAAKGNYLRLYQMEEWLEKALIERGYEDELPDSTNSLRDWIQDVKPAYASARGRPRKIP